MSKSMLAVSCCLGCWLGGWDKCTLNLGNVWTMNRTYMCTWPGMQQCAGCRLVMVCGMYHSVTGRNPPMRCRGSGVTIVRCQGPGHRSYYSLTHSPSLSGADNSAAFSAQLRTEIVNTNICYGCHTIGTEQSGNEWPTRIRSGIM